MHDIKFIVRIMFMQNGSQNYIDYTLLAKSSEMASSIAQEMFIQENFKNIYNIQAGTKIVQPSNSEIIEVREKYNNIFMKFRDSIRMNNYSKFIQNYTVFGGYDYFNNDSVRGYTVDFDGFEFKLCFNVENQICYIDEREVLYTSHSLDQKFVIRDNGLSIFIGSM